VDYLSRAAQGPKFKIPLPKSCPQTYRVFQKSNTQNILEYFSLLFSLFAWNFANLLASHIHIHIYLIYKCLQIYLNISSNGVNFSTSTHPFQPVKFWLLSIHWDENTVYQLFRNDVIFPSSRVLVSDNSKQNIETVSDIRVFDTLERRW